MSKDAQSKNAIAVSLTAAQMEMGKALKQSENPHFRSKYADLGSVMDACLEPLNKHGIAVIQPTGENEYGRFVKTVFIHGESGETLECEVPLIIGKNDMQGYGSAVTYARRYGLMTMAGIAPEDDDGNAAAKAAPPKKQPNWVETITQDLPPEATPRDKAEAITNALCAQFRRMKGLKQIDLEWDRREPLISNLESKHNDLWGKVIESYEQRRNELDGSAS